ncbi:protein of unknown function [Candidatus Nitrosocosmicus franklandus]|uniref:Uncharacterized protein n=1 Tax=Candidatus Nitrosocosmicus franklandianus TaxID=1798806 RepID=A0A484I9G4_9ARCH|nr:protein of unknown function [Candidatus Nitrosocosmicus franklandus]
MPQILQIVDKIKSGNITHEEFKKFCKFIEDIPALERMWIKLLWDKHMSNREDSS